MTKVARLFELGATAIAVLIMLALFAKPIITDTIIPGADTGTWSTGAAALWSAGDFIFYGAILGALVALGASIYHR